MPFPPNGVDGHKHADKRQPGEIKLNWIVRCNVRARRRELRLTQTQLAHCMGISKVHMTHLERGRNVSEDKLVYFSLEKIENAAKHLMCEPFDLLVADRFKRQ